MKPKPETHAPDFWTRKANALRFLVNSGWWWTSWVKGMLGGAVPVAVGLLTLRVMERPVGGLWFLYFLWSVVWGVWSLRAARVHLLTLPSALSRIDVSLGHHHRLVSALDGVGPWPEPPPRVRLPLRWEARVAAIPPLVVALLLVTAARVPLRPAEEQEEIVRQEPAAWTEIETFIEEVRREELISEEALEVLERELSALRDKPREEWYRQGSLETTDQLRSEVEREARALMNNLQQMAALIETAAAQRDQLSPDLQDRMNEAFQELLREVGASPLSLTPEMLAQLQEMDLSQIEQLSAEDLQTLEEKLSGACELLGMCMVSAGMNPGDEEGMAMLAAMLDGASGLPGDTESAQTPLRLGDAHPRADPGQSLALEHPDMARAALGDMLGIAEGEHEVDPLRAAGPGGGFAPGGEGEAVWQDDILPTEEAFLQNYFQ